MRGTQRPVLRGLDDFRVRVQEPLRGPFLWLLLHFCSPDKEVFRHMLSIHRRNWVFADPAMDQSMREVGVSFHAHDLVARPAARAHNVAPAMVISLISLAYVEEDGLLLSVALLAAIILIGIASAVWGTIVGAVLISV
jgi:hypothetical protein